MFFLNTLFFFSILFWIPLVIHGYRWNFLCFLFSFLNKYGSELKYSQHLILTLSWFNWRTWFQLMFSKSSRNDWLLNFSQSWYTKLYLVGGEFGRNSGSIKNCGRWSDILKEMFPDIALLTSGFGILQKISIRVLILLDILIGRRFWRYTRSSKKELTCSDLSTFNRLMLKWPWRTIALLASLDRLSNKGLR